MTGVARFLTGAAALFCSTSLLIAQQSENRESLVSSEASGDKRQGEGKPKAQFGEPPRVAILQKELEEKKAGPSFESLKAAAIKEAEPYFLDPVILPKGYGSWVFYYANPATGARLRPRSLTEHEDPQTGEIFVDERTQAAYRTLLHYRAEAAALAMAWAWAWSGEEKYAEEVRRILVHFAADYSSYPARLDRWGQRGFFARWGGRRYVQALDEATGVIALAKAYDLTRGSSVYTESDHTAIQHDFFRATADSLLRFNQGTVNHQTWYNAGLMAIAGVLGDARLAERVVTMRGGYRDQLRRAVGKDGLWWEGTLAYHLYALSAMMQIVEMGERYGMALGDEPKLRRMFTAALPLAFPNGGLPAMNDSDPMNLTAFRPAWEWALKQWGNPLYQRLLSEPLAKVLPEQTSQALPDAGVVVLRRGSGEEASIAYIDYGPHGGAHGHFDKLGLILYANKHEWLPDPGRLTYSHAEYASWVKTTAAHNTVAINERNQAPTIGKLLFLEENEAFAAAGVESQGAYEGTVLRRHLVMTDQFLIDFFEVLAPRRGTIDLLAHARADRLQTVGGGEESAQPIRLGTRDGYGHLAPAVVYPGTVQQWAFVRDSGERLGVHLLPDEGERLIATAGIGYTSDERTPTLIRRRSARSTLFVTVYDLTGEASAVKSLQPLTEGGEGVVVETAVGAFRVEIKRDGISFETQKGRFSETR